MKTPGILHYEDDPAGAMSSALTALESGKPIVFPTDTVYGLLAAHWSAAAYHSLFKLKNRDPLKPVAALVYSSHGVAGEALHALEEWPDAANEFTAGKLTAVLALEHLPSIPADMRKIQPGKLGLRCPLDERTRQLLSQTNGLLWATSVNRAGNPAATTTGEVDDWLLSLAPTNRPLAVVTATKLPGQPSAVVEIIGNTLLNLR